MLCFVNGGNILEFSPSLEGRFLVIKVKEEAKV